MLGSCTVFLRWACEQTLPGNALTARHFVALSGAPRYVALYELNERKPEVPDGNRWSYRVYRAYAGTGSPASATG